MRRDSDGANTMSSKGRDEAAIATRMAKGLGGLAVVAPEEIGGGVAGATRAPGSAAKTRPWGAHASASAATEARGAGVGRSGSRR